MSMVVMWCDSCGMQFMTASLSDLMRVPPLPGAVKYSLFGVGQPMFQKVLVVKFWNFLILTKQISLIALFLISCELAVRYFFLRKKYLST